MEYSDVEKLREIFDEAIDRCRRIAGLGDDHEILFLQGGASM